MSPEITGLAELVDFESLCCIWQRPNGTKRECRQRKRGKGTNNSGGPGCLEIEGCGKWCRPTEGNGVGKS